jgi:photoactive yellow protein
MNFDAISLADLAGMADQTIDDLPFGVVGLDPAGMVEIYNAREAQMAGLDPAAVIGVSFFDAVAQCMNNFMVAQRFEDEPELDEIIPYILTLKMRPTRVRLRLLATATDPRRFILIER